MPDKAVIEQVIEALKTVYDIRDECQGNTETARRIEKVVAELVATETDNSKYGGIRINVADAISRTYLRKPLARP